jgi:hypothetical protein
MEMTPAAKYGLGSGARGLRMMEGDALANKCIKRRRRESPAPAISCNEGEQQQKRSTTTAGGVKRSSRFRGVSRFDMQIYFLIN